MKVTIESKFLLPTDFNDGDKITFTNEGEEKAGQWGKKMQIGIKLANGIEKIANVSNTSKKWMVEHFSDESKEWISKEVSVYKVKQMIAGEMKTVIYLGEVPGMEEEDSVDSSGIEEVADDAPPFLQ